VRVPKWMVLAAAAALQVAHQALWIDTPSFVLNRAMDYYVFFFLGYAISGVVFDVADRAKVRVRATVAILAGWAVCNYALTQQGFHHVPLYGLMMGLAGALAVVEAAALLSKWKSARFLRYCGQNSIVIYLTFFFPMTFLERFLAKSQIIPDVGWACFAILVISAAAPLLFHFAIRKTPLIALYLRPKMFRLGNEKPKLVEAAA